MREVDTMTTDGSRGSELNAIDPYVVYVGHLSQGHCPPHGDAFLPRNTKWYELELIMDGGGYIDSPGSRSSAFKGRLFFRKPGMRVQGFPPYSSYYILFGMRADSAFSTSFAEQPPGIEQLYGEEPADKASISAVCFPEVTDVQDCREWEKLCRDMHHEFISNGGNNQFYLKTRVLQLLVYLWEHRKSGQQVLPSAHGPAIMKVKATIDREPFARYELAKLARQAGMSRSFFCSRFAEVVGLPPIAYVNDVRIYHAKGLLLQTGLSVNEIADTCGFATVTYFFRVFKRLVGLTPLQYRLQSLYKSKPRSDSL
ncbi:AraC family transcriptional regulator [Paenibacillaceae bacterium]|nr:AraC family transcriptional regulator [Paenibacillaceae bacterium]